MIHPLLFYSLAFVVLAFSSGVLIASNPIFCAFSLAVSMVSLAFVFFALGAYFIGAVQLAVYAGAVMVLFVMVLMLFNLNESEENSPIRPIERLLKVTSVGVILGVILGGITLSGISASTSTLNSDPASMLSTKNLAITLFDKYLFEFEALGILLLVVAIGVVSVSRIKGGTHARSK